MELKRQIGPVTATFIVVASMIGTGIFITTGIVLGMCQSVHAVLLLWIVGGVTAIAGTLCYAELASMWPHVGGEYVYLKKIFGLVPAFLTGWISLIVGFSASTALSSLAFSKYINQFMQGVSSQNAAIAGLFSGDMNQKFIAAFIIVLLGLLHIFGVKEGSRVQNVLTAFKLIVVITFVLLGFYSADWSSAHRLTAVYTEGGGPDIGLPVFGLALLIIMFSYSGWNGAAYIAGEMKNPGKNLPRALFFGTLIVTLLYIALNAVFLISSPGSEIINQEAVGAIAANNLFSPGIAKFYTLGIAVILLSSVSVQMMIGPRVYYAMALDRVVFAKLKHVSPKFNTPVYSIMLQIVIAVVYVFTGSAKSLMEYMGFALGIFPLMAVAGLIYFRIRHPEIERPFRVPLYPLTPIVFIVLTSGMMIAALSSWTATSLFALGAVIAGVPVYYGWRWFLRRRGSAGDH